MQLECSWNVPTRIQECPECTSNASRLPSESISIFSVLKEPNLNALGMPSESFECTSNASRLPMGSLDSRSNAVGTSRLGFKNAPNASRLPSESISIFSVLKESNSNALRMPSESFECTSNAFRLPLESLDCRSNAVGTSRLGFKNTPKPPESILIFSLLKEPNSNAPRKHLDCRRNPSRYFR